MSTSNELVTRLEIVPVRQAFRNEARHFTRWLEEHIEALSERLGIELTVQQREKAVGDFNVDLLCEDAEGHPVIVENQLERTDHSHLGQLLTYLVNLEASMAIWVTTEPRAEHLKVIQWLNEGTPANIAFYLVKVEAIRIKDSPFAPLFTVMAGPDKQAKEIGEKKKEWAARHYSRQEFWKELLERSKDKTTLFANISPSKDNWISTGAGKSGVNFNYVVAMESGRVELYIDHDKDTGQKNKVIYDAFLTDREAIEQEFGSKLGWERMDDKRASRISNKFEIGGLAKPESWPELQMEMIEGMIRLERAMRPRLEKIRV
jgi:hypothetical protein